jgi:hypothetical protein
MTAAAGQPAKIAEVFTGIHAYGLPGFVWFDSANSASQGLQPQQPCGSRRVP